MDRTYCAADIDRALHSPSLQGYEAPARKQQPVPTMKPAGNDTSGSVPFSGLDLALFGGVGGPLLLLGASLGRLARVKPEAIDG